jgi:hypothetical protein
VLGAGNCNDLDLPALLDAHREVSLVDLDAGALERGAASQGVATQPGLRLHGGLDATAMLAAMAGWTPSTTIDRADLTALAEWPCGRVAMALGGPFSLVASTCLLSQLVNTAFHVLGDRHPQFDTVLQAIRVGHLRLLAHLAGSGGDALLISDVVSSDRCPALSTIAESELAGLLPQLAKERNHIHGVHPANLVTDLRNDPLLRRQVAAVETVPPGAGGCTTAITLFGRCGTPARL